MGGGRVGTVLCLAALAVPAVGAAQTPYGPYSQPMSPAADREAREHFERGREAFSRGDFALAATQFEQAYTLSHRSALLYNVGAAYDRLHRWAEANTAFRQYLAENPMAPDRPEAEARLRMIAVELDRQRSAPVVSPATAGTAPQSVLVVAPPAVAADPPRPWRTVFYTGGALTAGALAVTIVLGVVSNQRYNALLTSCAPSCLAIDVDDMRQRQLFVNLGIATTGALAVGTAAAFLLDWFRPRASREDPGAPHARATVLPTPGGLALGVEGTL